MEPNNQQEFKEALDYLMAPRKHEGESLKEFSHRKFRADRIKKKLVKNRIVINGETNE